MVPDTTPNHQRQIACYEALQEVKAERDALQRRLDDYIAMEGRLNMEINAALNERDEWREANKRLVDERDRALREFEQCRDRATDSLKDDGWRIVKTAVVPTEDLADHEVIMEEL